MAIVLDVITSPTTGEVYEIREVKNISSKIVHVYPINEFVAWGLPVQGEYFLHPDATAFIAITSRVVKLIADGILELVVA